MSTEMARATAMTSAVEIMVEQPSTKVFTSSFSSRPPTRPMMIEITKNQMPHSVKYHSPSGRPVRKALHAVLGLSGVAPRAKKSMPKLSQGMNEMIMTMNDSAKSTSTSFCLPVSTASLRFDALSSSSSTFVSSA